MVVSPQGISEIKSITNGIFFLKQCGQNRSVFSPPVLCFVLSKVLWCMTPKAVMLSFELLCFYLYCVFISNIGYFLLASSQTTILLTNAITTPHEQRLSSDYNFCPQKCIWGRFIYLQHANRYTVYVDWFELIYSRTAKKTLVLLANVRCSPFCIQCS